MIRSNLALILEERKLKLEDVSNSIGIPLYKLNALNYNEIQKNNIKTIDKLCTQLNITPEQLFTYITYYLKVDHINYMPQTDKLEIIFEIKDDKGSTMYPIIYGNYSLNTENDLSIITNFTKAGQFSEVEIKNELLFKILKELPEDFLLDLELEIFNIVVALINLESINSLKLNWPKELYMKQLNL